MQDKFSVGAEGHLKIIDVTDGRNEVLVNKRNAIHKENASIILAAALANRDVEGGLYRMDFGTGGASVDTLGNINYLAPNVTGNSDLHNPIYSKVIDDNRGADSGSSMSIRHVSGTQYTDIEVRCLLGLSEPAGQPSTDTLGSNNINGASYSIDEIALKSDTGRLFSHVVFSPVIKSANREIEIIYTIRLTIN